MKEMNPKKIKFIKELCHLQHTKFKMERGEMKSKQKAL